MRLGSQQNAECLDSNPVLGLLLLFGKSKRAEGSTAILSAKRPAGVASEVYLTNPSITDHQDIFSHRLALQNPVKNP